jgi:hypothetical protein
MSYDSMGVILRVNEDGIAFLEETDSKACFVFTFDKLAGYSGQTAKELGLRVGSYVNFSHSGNAVLEVRFQSAHAVPSGTAASPVLSGG